MGFGRKLLEKFSNIFADKLVEKSFSKIQQSTDTWTSDKILAALSVIGDLFNRPISETTTTRISNAFKKQDVQEKTE